MAKIPAGASGIYQIRCVANDKIYIGSSVDLLNRWRDHCRTLRSGDHSNKHLQAAWDKYGENWFDFTIIEYVGKDELLAAEQYWIDPAVLNARLGLIFLQLQPGPARRIFKPGKDLLIRRAMR